MFLKIGVLKNFLKFTEKYLFKDIKLHSKPITVFKRDSGAGV